MCQGGRLRRYRLTMEMKCADLAADQLASRSVPPSTMSLLGLIRHMADVERHWFRRMMAQSDAPFLHGADDVFLLILGRERALTSCRCRGSRRMRC